MNAQKAHELTQKQIESRTPDWILHCVRTRISMAIRRCEFKLENALHDIPGVSFEQAKHVVDALRADGYEVMQVPDHPTSASLTPYIEVKWEKL